MNKELIKKYKAEFDHWLNGGKLLLKQINLVIPAEWEKFEEDWDWPIEELAVIINDEFIEFRKALAEGKTIQYNFGNYGINRKDFPNSWKDLDQSIGILADRACPENYRIKPEEPKFKVGDWVVEIHSTTKAQVLELFGNQIRVKFCYPDAIITTDSSDFIPWVPKNGEWCWFSNKNGIPTIGQFLSIETDGNRKYSATFPNTPHPFISYYDYCEPFLGHLPTNLQGIK